MDWAATDHAGPKARRGCRGEVSLAQGLNVRFIDHGAAMSSKICMESFMEPGTEITLGAE